MKIKSFLVCLALGLLCLPAPSQGGEIAVFTAKNPLEVHDEALRGFMSVCHAPEKEFEVSGKDISGLKHKIAAFAPRLIFAIGSDAFNGSLQIDNGTPVVFALVLRKKGTSHPRGPVTGIDLMISPRRQLEVIREVLPKTKRIGVVYNPAETGAEFRAAEKAAPALGMKIIGRTAATAAEAIKEISSLRGRIDVLWLFPDVTVLDYETVKYAMLFSFQTRVPVVAPSAEFVRNGALLGLGLDAYDIGVQAGQMANLILSGRSARDIPVAYARKIVISVNVGIARKFGITIPSNILKKSLIYGEER